MTQKTLVVYVDNDPDDLEIFDHLYSSIENAPPLKTFTNGEEALRFLKELQNGAAIFCYTLLDINMPGMNGKEVALHMKKDANLNGIPIAFYTTSPNPKDKEFAQSIGAQYYQKAVSATELLSVAQEVVNHCKSLHSAKIIS